MRTSPFAGVAFAAALGAMSAGFAQDSGVPVDDTETGTETGTEAGLAVATNQGSESRFIELQQDNQVRADSLIGTAVVNSAGDELGSVSDLLVDDKGRITGLLISSGGVLGIGAKVVAVPWSDATRPGEGEPFVVDIAHEEIAAAPDFKTKEQQELEHQEQLAREQLEQNSAIGGQLQQP